MAEDMDGIEIVNPGVKSRERASAKVETDYLGDHNMIKDIVRAAFMTKADSDFKSILRIFKRCKQNGYSTYQTKNLFKYIPDGPNYADLKVVKVVGGVFAEIQFLMKEIYTVKEDQSHEVYEKIQAIERQYKPTKEKPGDDWSEEHKAEYDALCNEMK